MSQTDTAKPADPAKTTSTGGDLDKTRRKYEGFKHAIIFLVLGLELVPIYMMLQISFKDNQTFLTNPWLPNPPDDWRWGNYAYAFKLVLPYLANTVFIAVLTVSGGLACAIMAAYFFARYRMPFREILFGIFLFLMIMPSVANLVPLFNLLTNLSLINTLWAIIIVGTAGAQAFNIFILRNFIEDLPYELFEAAEVDGASHIQQIWHVVVPTCGSIISTLAILMFIREWNEYLLPLVVLRDKELFPLGVGLIYMDGESIKRWGHIMAVYTVASIPLMLLFLLSMRAFIRGLTSGAVKG